MSALKVLIVGPSLTRSKGGMATVINDIINHHEKGFKIECKHIVSHIGGNVLEKAFVFFKAIIQIIIERPFDIIHIHVASDISIFRKSIFILLGHALGRPVIMHMHGADFDVWFEKSSYLVKRFVTKIFSLCAKVLVLSDYWKTFFKNNIPHPNVEVLHNGVHTDEFEECIYTPQHYKNFIFLGRLCHRKGIYDLLQAINIIVKQQHHEELMFFLAGDGDLEQVQEIIEAKDLSQNVQVLGWLSASQRKGWLSQVETLILPSYSEGLPMAILEAMSAGKIIISSRTGGIPDVVSAENGFLIQPGDVNSLCEYISYVHANPEQMRTIAINNMSKISKHYEFSSVKTRLFEIYHELAKVNLAPANIEAKTQYSHANQY